MKNSFDNLLEESVRAKAFHFYWLTCGSFEAQIATFAPISTGDTIQYKDEEDERPTKYIVKHISHSYETMSTDHRILTTFLECEEA